MYKKYTAHRKKASTPDIGISCTMGRATLGSKNLGGAALSTCKNRYFTGVCWVGGCSG